MHARTLRHYRTRLRRSERLRYRIARSVLSAVALGALVLAVAYLISAHG